MGKTDFSLMTNDDLLNAYECREYSGTDFQDLLSEIAKRWAKKEKLKYLPLRFGDDIWYTDLEMPPEHGIIFSADYSESGELVSFSVNFDNGDFDEFVGEALNRNFFKDKDDALTAIFN